MQKVKKSSLYISLLFIGTLLSGCGDVSHHYYSASKSHSSSVVTVSSKPIVVQPAAVVFENGDELFATPRSDDLHYDIPLQEFGDGTSVYIGLNDPGKFLCVLGEVNHYSVELRIDIPKTLILYDANNDGYRDLCMSFDGRGYVEIYDLYNDEELYYVSDSNVTIDGYWLSLENDKLMIHASDGVNPYLESHNYGCFKCENNGRVYVEWKDYLDIGTLNVTYQNTDKNSNIAVGTSSANSRAEIAVKNGYYSFWIKGSKANITKNDIHISARDKRTRITAGTNVEDTSAGFGFSLAFDFSTSSYSKADGMSFQVLCSVKVIYFSVYRE